mmetsp:Transcript_11562/g.28076  ORF Transcript_11562/g.28076 Transcript_11562/m.28076 type:complete len:214 (-) Transcript_11562:2406-3047(-)
MLRRRDVHCTARVSCPPTSTAPPCVSYSRYSSRSTVDLPLPLAPTSARLPPAGTLKLSPLRTLARPADFPPAYPKTTSLNSMSSPSGGTDSGGAPGTSTMPGRCSRRSNMAAMSISDCRVSRYTVPRKLSGTDSWNNRPFTITKSPTVSSPRATPAAHNSMAEEMEAEKMAFCPKLSADSELCVLSAAASYPCRHSSKRRLSCASLLKYFTVS